MEHEPQEEAKAKELDLDKFMRTYSWVEGQPNDTYLEYFANFLQSGVYDQYPDQAVELISRMAENPNPLVRVGAAGAVGRLILRDKEAGLALLKQLLADNESGVVREARESFDALFESPDFDALDVTEVLEVIELRRKGEVEAIAALLTSPPEEDPREALRARFTELVEDLKSRTEPLSLMRQVHGDPAYQEIVSMGPDVLPYILEEIRSEPENRSW